MTTPAACSTVPTLYLGDVKVGDELPELAVDVTTTLEVLGALASRDWLPQHHDLQFAIRRNGLPDLYLNTPNQVAWFERYLTDWTGPFGRLGRLSIGLRSSVFPGDRMVLGATVTGVATDASGCGWVELDARTRVGARVAATCSARLALPIGPSDNPWDRRGEAWRPGGDVAVP